MVIPVSWKVKCAVETLATSLSKTDLALTVDSLGNVFFKNTVEQEKIYTKGKPSCPCTTFVFHLEHQEDTLSARGRVLISREAHELFTVSCPRAECPFNWRDRARTWARYESNDSCMIVHK